MDETSTTASMIKAWIVADYLRRADKAGQTPSDAKLADATRIIRDSDNTRAEQFYNSVGRSASIKRLISICKTDRQQRRRRRGLEPDRPLPRDTARLGDVHRRRPRRRPEVDQVADQRDAAGPGRR